jgi:hypothetical protein
MSRRASPLLALLALCIPGLCGAVTITWNEGDAPLPVAEDFNKFIAQQYPDVLAINAAKMSGVFAPGANAGTVAGPNGNYETYTGAPQLPLTLFGQGSNENLWLWNYGTVANPQVSPFGMLNGNGTGAVSLLFDIDQLVFGIDVIGAELGPGAPGTLFATFYGRTGVVVDTLQVPVGTLLSTHTPFGIGPFTFTSTVPFAAVILTTNDNRGLAYDNFRYDTPTPSSASLIGLGLLVVAGRMRRRRAGLAMNRNQ